MHLNSKFITLSSSEYSVVEYLTRDQQVTHGKLTKTRKRHIQESQEFSPFLISYHKATRYRHNSIARQRQITKIYTKEAPPWKSQYENYWRAKTSLMVPTLPLIMMWSKTLSMLNSAEHEFFTVMNARKLINQN